MGEDLEIRWAYPHRLYVIVGGKYYSRVRGLCGNYDDNKMNDRESPEGMRLDEDINFELSWILDDDQMAEGWEG